MATALAEKPPAAPEWPAKEPEPLPDVIRLSVLAQWVEDTAELDREATVGEVCLALRNRYPTLASVQADDALKWLRIIPAASWDAPVFRYRMCGWSDEDRYDEDRYDDDEFMRFRLVRLGTDDPGPEDDDDTAADDAKETETTMTTTTTTTTTTATAEAPAAPVAPEPPVDLAAAERELAAASLPLKRRPPKSASITPGAGDSQPGRVDQKAPAGLAVIVAQPALKDALAIVGRTAGGERAMPIFASVLIEGGYEVSSEYTGGTLTLTCSDLESSTTVALREWQEGSGSAGRFAAPVRVLSELVGAFGNAPVTLTQDGPVLRVECGGARAKVKGPDADDYPPVPDPEGAPLFSVPAAALAQGLGVVDFALGSGRESGREMLGCVHLRGVVDGVDGEGARLALEAANGYALARWSRSCDEIPVFDALLPRAAATHLSRLLDDAGDEAVEVWLLPKAERPNQLRVRASSETRTVTLTARLWSGTYYDLAKLLAAERQTTITAGREALAAAFRQVAVLADRVESLGGEPGRFTVTLRADPAGRVELWGQSAERGEHRVELPAEVLGPAQEVLLNGVYVVGCLRGLPGETVRIGLSGQHSPVLVEDVSLPEYRAVMAPMVSGGASVD